MNSRKTLMIQLDEVREVNAKCSIVEYMLDSVREAESFLEVPR